MKQNPAVTAILKSRAEDRLTRPEAAAHLGVTTQTLATWACVGRYALPYTKVGSKVYYRRSDCDAWLAMRTVDGNGGRHE